MVVQLPIFFNKLFFQLLLMTTAEGNMAVLILFPIYVLEKLVQEHLVGVMETVAGHWYARMQGLGSCMGL